MAKFEIKGLLFVAARKGKQPASVEIGEVVTLLMEQVAIKAHIVSIGTCCRMSNRCTMEYDVQHSA